MVVKKEVLEEYGWKDPSLSPWDWKEISQALHEGLKNWTKKLFTNVWWKANPLAVSYSTLVVQFALRFTSVQLNTFWFVVFALLGWFGFFFPSSYLIFSSLKSSASIFQPSLAVSSNAQVPPSDNSRVPKANTTLKVISHSQEYTGSPPWMAIPLLQNYYSLCLSCCSPSFGGYLRPAQASSRLEQLQSFPAQMDQSPRNSV